MIKGNLASFSLGEIFQSLAVNNHSGTLKIVEKDRTEKYVYFSQGEICLFSINTLPSLRIGEILIRLGKITNEQLVDALEFQKTTKDKLGQVLIKNYGLSPDDIQEALTTKIYEEIYDLFLLNEAEFEFFIDHFPEEVFESFPDNSRISINTYSVVMEGLRVADEWKIIKKKIKTFNEIYALTASAEEKSFDTSMDIALYQLVDGETPVLGIFEKFPGSRFDCCKTLFGFLGAGLIRPLTLEECHQGGMSAGQKNDLQQSYEFLQFAVELSPDKPEPLVLLGNLHHKLKREVEGREAHFKAARLFSEKGNADEVINLCEPMLKYYKRDEEFLEILFKAAVEREKAALVEACGEIYATAQYSRGLKSDAADTLLTIYKLSPRDFERKLRAANFLKEAGSTAKAIQLMEEVAEELSGVAKINDRVRVLRSIYELAPARQDIKQEIANLYAQQERYETSKKRRFTIAGLALISSVLLLVIPLLYEIKARELMSHAQRLEQISRISGDYSVAKATYEELLESYRFSTQNGKAREALERLRWLEMQKTKIIEDEVSITEKEQEEKLQKMKTTITKLLAQAQELEQRKDFEGAFTVLKKISTDFTEFPKTKLIPLPFTITTFPSGCLVRINGKKIGNTPLVIREKAGEELTIELSRSGCETLQKSVTVGEDWNLHFKLNLHPLAEFSLSGPVQHPLDSYEGDIFFPSRDGFLYSIDPANKSVQWRHRIGKYGDLVSNPCYTTSEIILGNVEGEIAARTRSSGRARWRTSLKTTILATPALSDNGRWVAVGDLNGNVFIINNQNGKPQGAFRTENEIIHTPVFWGNVLVVASEDNTLSMLAVPTAKLIHTVIFDHDIDSELLLDQNVLYFCTRDGTAHCYNLKLHKQKWQRTLAARCTSTLVKYKDQLLLGTEEGELIAIGTNSGKIQWRSQLSDSEIGDLLLHDNRVYFGTLDGEIISYQVDQPEIKWMFRFEDSIQIAPTIVDERLYFVSTSGKFVVLEIFQ